jgi:hypothetical protein
MYTLAYRLFRDEGENLVGITPVFGGDLNMISLLSVQGEPALSVPGFEKLIAAIVIVGLLTQVVIQTAKDLFPMRFLFQETWIRRWLAERVNDLNRAAAEPRFREASRPDANYETKKIDFGAVEEDMLRLAASGDRTAFYGLTIEQLCGQLNAALRAALEDPTQHNELISVFAKTAKKDDLKNFFNAPASLRVTSEMSPEARASVQAFAESRNRVAYHTERSVDDLQISIGKRWKFRLQVSSFGLSLGFAAFGVGEYWNETNTLRAIRDVFVVGVLGGYLAPVIRDILARLQQRAV